MKLMLWLLALSGYTITVHGSLEPIVTNPGGIGGIYKGPDSETIVQGPDGSIITSQQQGGVVQTDSRLDPIVAAEPAILEVGIPIPPPPAVQTVEVSQSLLPPPLLPAPATIAALPESAIVGTLSPSAAAVTPIPLGHTIEIIEPDPHIIETEIVDAPVIEPQESSELIGPSGSISTRGSESIVSGPASTTITKSAKILVAPPVISAVPVVASVSTPIHAVPLVEVNNELPLSSPVPVGPISVSPGPLWSSTVSPLSGSSVSPLPNGPLITISTLAPSRANQPIPVLPSGPRVIPLDGIGHVLGSTVRPSTVGQPLNGYSLGSTTAPPILVQPSPGPIATPNIIRQPGFVSSTPRPVLLTGEQYDDVRPGSVANPGPPVFRQPAAPGLLYNDQFTSVRPDLVSSVAPPLLRQPTTPQSHNILLSTSSTGVNIVDEGSNGIIRPGGIQSTTVGPVSSTLAPPPYNIQNVPQEWLVNRQLVVDPAQIPYRNIVPPEIGIPRGAIDLGSTVQTITTPAPGAPAPSSPNIQRIDTSNGIADTNIQRIDNLNSPEVERTLQNGYYQNEIIVGNRGQDGPLLTSTNPVRTGVNIPPRGLLGTELNRAGIDSSQIHLTNVPLSDVAGLQGRSESSSSSDYDDTVAASLWNRYGRKTRNRN